MFDISFAEMLVVGVVALVVLGPERLPRVAHTLGHLLGRAQRYMNDVKNDIQREIELEELKKLKASVEDTARSIEEAAQTEIRQFQKGMAAPEEKTEPGAESPPQSTDRPPMDTLPPDASYGSAATLKHGDSPESSQPGRTPTGTEVTARN